jgi:hypothetical protein
MCAATDQTRHVTAKALRAWLLVAFAPDPFHGNSKIEREKVFPTREENEQNLDHYSTVQSDRREDRFLLHRSTVVLMLVLFVP